MLWYPAHLGCLLNTITDLSNFSERKNQFKNSILCLGHLLRNHWKLEYDKMDTMFSLKIYQDLSEL